MPQYVFNARVTLDGAWVSVEAENPQAARAKAESGDWIDSGSDGASWADWKIGPITHTEN